MSFYAQMAEINYGVPFSAVQAARESMWSLQWTIFLSLIVTTEMSLLS